MNPIDLTFNDLAYGSGRSFDDSYLTRLRKGDEEIAKHFYGYFRRLLRRRLWGKFTREQEEELIDSSILAAFTKIRTGEPRNAERLPAYITGICLNLSRLSTRPSFNRGGEIADELQMSDGAESPEERMLTQERAQQVRTTLNGLPARDRDILKAVFYDELDRDEVCRNY